MERNFEMKISGLGTPVAIVSAAVLVDRQAAIHAMIERRAYELYERGGCTHGRDFDDWIQAENEFILPCDHVLGESKEAVILQATMPHLYNANQLQISVEPKQLIVSGEGALFSNRNKSRAERRAERLFCICDLPIKVDASRTTAVLNGRSLFVKMPKAETPRSNVTAKAASRAA
jgi:HSP20 family molecular chaperone IbpA